MTKCKINVVFTNKFPNFVAVHESILNYQTFKYE